MIQLTDNVFAETLPPGNYGEGLIIEVDGKYYLNLIDEEGVMLAGTKPLPPGSWRFLFTTKTATEEDARKVVERWEDLKDRPYVGYEPGKLTVCWNALQSLRSLLRSKKLDDNNNYALIEKMSSDE